MEWAMCRCLVYTCFVLLTQVSMEDVIGIDRFLKKIKIETVSLAFSRLHYSSTSKFSQIVHLHVHDTISQACIVKTQWLQFSIWHLKLTLSTFSTNRVSTWEFCKSHLDNGEHENTIRALMQDSAERCNALILPLPTQASTRQSASFLLGKTIHKVRKLSNPCTQDNQAWQI